MLPRIRKRPPLHYCGKYRTPTRPGSSLQPLKHGRHFSPWRSTLDDGVGGGIACAYSVISVCRSVDYADANPPRIGLPQGSWCPGLSRPSTSWLNSDKKDVDGRDEARA